MRITALVLAITVLIALVSMGSTPILQTQEPGPTFDDQGRLLTPEGWQKWVLAGSSLGLGYTPRTRGENPGTFKHVYINPGSFDHYVRTGEFPDKTMLVMPVYSSENRSEPAENGWYPDRMRAMEAAVKDVERFEGGWGYFDLNIDDENPQAAEAFPRARCASCHSEHAAVDNVFVQFYPVLRHARESFEKAR